MSNVNIQNVIIIKLLLELFNLYNYIQNKAYQGNNHFNYNYMYKFIIFYNNAI